MSVAPFNVGKFASLLLQSGCSIGRRAKNNVSLIASNASVATEAHHQVGGIQGDMMSGSGGTFECLHGFVIVSERPALNCGFMWWHGEHMKRTIKLQEATSLALVESFESVLKLSPTVVKQPQSHVWLGDHKVCDVHFEHFDEGDDSFSLVALDVNLPAPPTQMEFLRERLLADVLIRVDRSMLDINYYYQMLHNRR
jgi:hypothetical protein